MLTLIVYPGNFGQISASPFCVKAAYLLALSGQTWEPEFSNDPRKAPRRKFPVLRTPEGLVHDSGNIREYLEGKGADFDGHLTSEQCALGHSLQRMVEEHMYFILLLDRWERDDVWPVIRDTYFSEIPKLVRGLITGAIRKTVLKGMDAQGLGRLTWDERMARVEPDLAAITSVLGDTPFLFGDRPCSFDACIAAHLGAMRSTPVKTPLSRRIAEDPMLSAYVDRAMDAMVPG